MNSLLRTIARRQGGAFSHAQALACGLGEPDITHGLFSGEWVAIHREVYAAASTPQGLALRAWAAVLAVGSPVALGGLWAAWAMRLDRAPEIVDQRPRVVVPKGRKCDRLIAVRAEQSRMDLPVRFVDGLPVLSPERVLRQLAADQPYARVRDMVQHALRRRTVTFNGLARELGRGRHGAARLRGILSEVAPGFQVVWEGRLYDALLARGVRLTSQLRVEVATGLVYLDLGDQTLRFGVEVDGLVAHLDRFAADRRRDRALHLAGWLVVHVAVSELVEDLDAAADEIAAAYHRRRLELSAPSRTA
jgi:very-short-patch-repair endonuclease